MPFAPARLVRFAPSRLFARTTLPTTLVVVLMMGATLGGCASRQKKAAAAKAAAQATAASQAAPVQTTMQIEKVPFRTGISTATVENLAKQQGCTGGQGAGLITEPGPVEIYRMQCDNGRVFRARCELRQCKQM